ncbi:LytR C-terminal domain-containing protein [Pseudarthrobacter sp. N5]|uniref:LytR C-terminal domain-containing protein n=1 Tax=Pseudarthrobacter sp. N5 TaxID=3418416 RepID=UPI003CF27A62
MARKAKDVTVLHGHRVVTGPELRATFVEDEDTAHNPVRLRRRIVHAVVLVLLIGLIISAIVIALAIMNGQIKVPTAERSHEAVSVCPAATFDYTPNEQINLNVYNSTTRPGLARSVADEFLGRKFLVGTVSNTQSGYRGVAAVVSGAAGQSAAFSVQRNVPGSDYFQDDRSDASVDVILTSGYKELTAPELVDQTPGKLSCPRESRRIADGSKRPVIPTAAATP